MALNSPGVEVDVIDQSFYGPAAPGTVPLIIVASAQDKMNASGTGIAVGTQQANAGKVYVITSQRDLTDTFGTPSFYTDAGGNPINGDELNEYGLQAAYSLLGVSSQAYVARADLDLGQLIPSSSSPEGAAADGTYWLDTTSNTLWGIFQWDEVAGAFTNKIPVVIDNDNMDTYLSNDMYTPKASLGVAGTYAIVATSANTITLWYKNTAGNWVVVGSNTETGFTAGVSFKSTCWQTSFPVVTGTTVVGDLTTYNGSTLVINGQTVTLSGTNLNAMVSSINSVMRTHGVNALVGTGNYIQLYADATAASNGASGAAAQAIMEVHAKTFANSGTNYAIGNVLTILGGTAVSSSTVAQITVTAVNTLTGAILAATITNQGEYTAIPSASGAVTTVNTGTGSGATLNLTFDIDSIQVTAPGVDYATAPTVIVSGSTVTNVTVSNGGLSAITVQSGIYTSLPSVTIQNKDVQDGKIKIQVGSTSTLLTALGLTAGTYEGPQLFQGPHTAYPDFTSAPSGSVYIKTTSPNQGASWDIKTYSAASASWTEIPAPIYSAPEVAIYTLDPAGLGKNIATGSVYVDSNYDNGVGSAGEPQLAEFNIRRRVSTGATTVTTPTASSELVFTSTSTFTLKEMFAGGEFSTPVVITINKNDTLEDVATYINAGSNGFQYVSATYNASTYQLTISHSTGGEIRFLDGTNTPLAFMGYTAWSRNVSTGIATGTANFYATGMYDPDGYTYRASNWQPLVFEATQVAPYQDPADGTYWYSSVVDEVDIMIHDGTKFRGYRNVYPSTDPNGPIISATAPKLSGGQSDGTDLVDGDIWISTADITKYGQEIYVWNGQTLQWVQQDPTDHTTPNGWIFYDARYATSGQATTPSTIKSLLVSDYVDPDSPDPALYPKGTRLWNLRRSGFNVKRYQSNYINVYSNSGKNIRYSNEIMDGAGGNTIYNTARWVTVSPNTPTGVGSFGSHAQRGLVVKSLKSLIDTSTAIRDTDTLVFNLIACPGYPETVQNLIGLNADRSQTAFVVGDTPFTLTPDATSLLAWGNNSNGAFDNGPDGAVSYDDYMAFYYPSGYTTDNTGNYIVVPPSHMMLRTIAESDQKSYPWFAPAGLRRGVVDNVSSVGYLDDQAEFHTTALPQGTRDVMAQVKINPIATLSGSGIVVMGQYTRASVASSLDRINVARLTAYIRRQLGLIAKPYLFEPNDKITRGEIKRTIESFLLQLVGQRALYDYIVVCDTSNNTPTRIDQNQLWVDIAIEPVKSVEFIYIPLRLENTGAIAAGAI
jgi:Phage tail sheath C-terminal domain/Flagellin hook IN motif